MAIGNDIVDLQDPESAPMSLHRRYLSRVFTAAERRVLDSRRGRVEIWSRWAAKEAAFKALSGDRPTIGDAGTHRPGAPDQPARHGLMAAPGPIFSPRAFATVLEPPTDDEYRRGWVAHEGERVPVLLRHAGGAVHAVAASAGELEGSTLKAVTFLVDGAASGGASGAVRRAACRCLARALGWEAPRVQIAGRRPPRFFLDGQARGPSVSLSHHGRWAAFAFVLVSRTAEAIGGCANGWSPRRRQDTAG